jgi:hypothetical protein
MICKVVELRQYTMVAGKRDALIALFDRVLTAEQEAVGMKILGVYHDLDRPDRLVWMRGFPDMASRRQALASFYEGPVWRAHRDEANATMLESHDVLLLRPLADPAAATQPPSSLVIAEIEGLGAPAWLESETAPNDYPRLPVREGAFLVYLTPPGGAPPPELMGLEVQRLRLAPALA